VKATFGYPTGGKARREKEPGEDDVGRERNPGGRKKKANPEKTHIQSGRNKERISQKGVSEGGKAKNVFC